MIQRLAAEPNHVGSPHDKANAEFLHEKPAQRQEILIKISSYSRKGKSFESITPDAMKNATTVSETNPTWKWSDQEPSLR
jgi:hypothetical protein